MMAPMKKLTRTRADRILHALGMSWADFARLMNRHFGTAYTNQDVSKWGRARDIPLPAAVALRALVEVVQSRRHRR